VKMKAVDDPAQVREWNGEVRNCPKKNHGPLPKLRANLKKGKEPGLRRTIVSDYVCDDGQSNNGKNCGDREFFLRPTAHHREHEERLHDRAQNASASYVEK